MIPIDDWRPSAAFDQLKRRAALIARIRFFFSQQGYLEVETPILSKHGVSDVYLQNIKAFFRDAPFYLQTSPEYHMKRLLAAGSGPIVQFSRVFRDDELGRWHNPEFSLLEWYQLDIDHHQLMDEVDHLLQVVLHCQCLKRITYEDAFGEHCGFNPFNTSLEELRQKLCQFDLDGVLDADESDFDQYLFLLMSHVVEPALSKEERPIAVYNFPPSQAALAVIKEGVSERFEIYFKGVELANGFHELTDSSLQRLRFEEDNANRLQKGQSVSVIDERFLRALEEGLPPCSGVAIGLDRLLALAMNQPSIAQVMAFDFSRA